VPRDREKYNAWMRANRHRYAEAERARRRTDRYRAHERGRAVERRAEQRRKLLDFLGGRCQRCGIADERLLQFHHANGGGNQHRREAATAPGGKGTSYRYYAELLAWARERPGSVELLCANCHILAEWELEHGREDIA